MAEAALERTVRFRATHRYGRADWSAERNHREFGALVEPHPHEYRVSVTVRGPVDEHGFVTDLGALDRALTRLVGPLEGAELGRAIPELGRGRLQPTTEALARWMWEALAPAVAAPARLARVRVAESADLAAEYEG